MTRFETGDVVLVRIGHEPHGLAIAIEAIEDSLRLHDGTAWKSCYFLHPSWCRKVGRVDDAVVGFCLASHAQVEPLVKERLEDTR